MIIRVERVEGDKLLKLYRGKKSQLGGGSQKKRNSHGKAFAWKKRQRGII